MNDYFDGFEQSVGAAVERGAHLSWYSRGRRLRHPRVFVAVFGALVIGAPAGAVSNCFGACLSPPSVAVTVTPGPRPQSGAPSAVRSVPAVRSRSAKRPTGSS